MESAPAGATRMGSRSSTRHGGPALVFVGPVRKWRKVWAPVSSSSASSAAAAAAAAARVVLFKWTPTTPLTNGGGAGAKEGSTPPEETVTTPANPVKYLPVSVVLQRQREKVAREAAEAAEAMAEAEAKAQAEAQAEAQAQAQTEIALEEGVDSKEPTTSEMMVVDANPFEPMADEGAGLYPNSKGRAQMTSTWLRSFAG